ncbi:collagen-like protein [Arenibacter latericius]|uniref:collagen-like protein n=1 Tax=Arenibacter latericius TaxID=86104 RepID=UPI0003FFCB9F|nr:collagen-like protein [Arenibacter latericius]MDX1364617.1 collagen-like protein [Arenibacter latericius]
MKKLSILLGTFVALFFIACEGPAGPPGFDGLDGLDGKDGIDGSVFEALVFEIDVDLSLNTEANTYEFGEAFSAHNIELFQNDAILVYRLEEVDSGLDVWRQLPQPFFTDLGLLYYNFDFTQNDYKIYVEPDFDAASVANDLVTNQIFRVLIIPADVNLSSKMDKSNINAVMKTLGLTEKDVQHF